MATSKKATSSIRKTSSARSKNRVSKKKTATRSRNSSFSRNQRGAIRPMASLMKPSKKNLIIIAVIFAAIGAFFIWRSFAATTLLTTLQAESMMLPMNETNALVVSDTSADGGKAMQFKAKVLATGTANLTNKPASNKLTIRAKGTQCNVSPQMEVKVNGAQAKLFTVTSSWTDYTYAPTIAAGSTPQISVEFMNPTVDMIGNSGKVRCSSNLSVDKFGLYEVTADTIVANITSPENGSIVAGGIPVEAKPISSNGVSKVEFYVGGTAVNGYRDGTLKTENGAPWCLAGDGGTGACFNWDSRSVPNGSSTITAYTYDSANIRSSPQTVTITVSNTVSDPAPATAPAPAPVTNPSGQAMPVGDISGWKQIFTDDFTTNVPLGSFPSAVADKWGAYPYPWRDTKGQTTSDPALGGWYHPGKTVSIGNSMMDIWMHTEYLDGAKKRLVAAPQPKIKGAGTSAGTGQLYGRYAVRFRVDPARTTNNFTGYKTAWLLWPDVRPSNCRGETDFPEGDLDSTIGGFLHWQDAASCGEQYYAASGKSFREWHTAVTEWGPGRVAMYLDGALMTNASGGKSEWFSHTPNTVMHYVLQSETELGSTVPAENTEGHIQVDWVAVWSKI